MLPTACCLSGKSQTLWCHCWPGSHQTAIAAAAAAQAGERLSYLDPGLRSSRSNNELHNTAYGLSLHDYLARSCWHALDPATAACHCWTVTAVCAAGLRSGGIL